MPKPRPAPPCSHMKELLQDAADGRSRGLRLWLTLLHVLHCGPCRRYMDTLKAMVASLRGKSAEPMPEEIDARLSAKLAEATRQLEKD